VSSWWQAPYARVGATRLGIRLGLGYLNPNPNPGRVDAHTRQPCQRPSGAEPGRVTSALTPRPDLTSGQVLSRFEAIKKALNANGATHGALSRALCSLPPRWRPVAGCR